jgi:effector-binding domain-containing protein
MAKEATVKSRESIEQCVEREIEPMTVAGIRMHGRYSECGKLFGRLAKALYRHILGKPMNLYYDGEYREDDADFESCFPVKSDARTGAEGVSVHELPGGKFMTLIHKGPYEELGRSYSVIFEHVQRLGLRTLVPSREVYLKGPGMIFRGNPKNYLTEIQIPVEGPPKG